jgi:hypothetical protein
VFEHTLVLPEYLVEYEYDTTPACKLRTGANVPILDSEGQAALDGLDFDIRLIARPLVPLLLAANAAELDDNGNPVVKLSGKESGMEVINSGPQLEQKPKVFLSPPLTLLPPPLSLLRRACMGQPLSCECVLRLCVSGVPIDQ